MSIIFAAFYVPQLIQNSFKLGSVNAMSAIGNFTGPIITVFAFLEDTILVRLSYTLANGKKELANVQFWTGVRGAALTGCAAALVISIVGATQTGFGAVVNPGFAARYA